MNEFALVTWLATRKLKSRSEVAKGTENVRAERAELKLELEAEIPRIRCYH